MAVEGIFGPVAPIIHVASDLFGFLTKKDRPATYRIKGSGAEFGSAQAVYDELARMRAEISAPPVIAPPPIEIAPPPVEPIATVPPPTSSPTSPPPPSGGLSEESIRQQAERAARDTEIRRSAPPQHRVPGGARGGAIFEGEILKRAGGGVARAIGRAILGPVGAAIGGIIVPGELGSGEVSPEELAKNRREEAARRDREESIISEIGRDIFRGGAIGGAGIIIGGGVIVSELGKLPWPLPLPDELGDEPPVAVKVPRVDIPTPVIRQPSPLPLPQPPVASIPTPSPAGLPQPKTKGATRSRPTTQPTPAVFPQTPVFNAFGLIGGLAPSTRRSALTRPRSQTTTSTSSLTSSLTSSPTASPVANPLTSVETGVLGSSPPRTPTRTTSDQCRCTPKRRKPKRECRASAPVVWGGGPRKGQVAGSRCYSFTK